MTLSEAIALRFKNLLKEHKMTQYMLATTSGVPQSTVSGIIRNLHSHPSINVIYDLTQGFGISLSDFFNSELFGTIK